MDFWWKKGGYYLWISWGFWGRTQQFLQQQFAMGSPCHIIPVGHRGSIIYGENWQFSMAMLVVFRQALWKMMEWKSVGARWHSQYDGKVIIQPCSSHHQPAMAMLKRVRRPTFWWNPPEWGYCVELWSWLKLASEFSDTQARHFLDGHPKSSSGKCLLSIQGYMKYPLKVTQDIMVQDIGWNLIRC